MYCYRQVIRYWALAYICLHRLHIVTDFRKTEIISMSRFRVHHRL